MSTRIRCAPLFLVFWRNDRPKYRAADRPRGRDRKRIPPIRPGSASPKVATVGISVSGKRVKQLLFISAPTRQGTLADWTAVRAYPPSNRKEKVAGNLHRAGNFSWPNRFSFACNHLQLEDGWAFCPGKCGRVAEPGLVATAPGTGEIMSAPYGSRKLPSGFEWKSEKPKHERRASGTWPDNELRQEET